MDLNKEVEKWIGDVFDRGVTAGLDFASAIVEACEEQGLSLETARGAIRNLQDRHQVP